MDTTDKISTEDRITLEKASISKQEFFMLMDAYSNIKEMYVCIINNQSTFEKGSQEYKAILNEVLKIIQTHERAVDELKITLSGRVDDIKKDIALSQSDMKVYLETLKSGFSGKIDSLKHLFYVGIIGLIGIIVSLLAILASK